MWQYSWQISPFLVCSTLSEIRNFYLVCVCKSHSILPTRFIKWLYFYISNSFVHFGEKPICVSTRQQNHELSNSAWPSSFIVGRIVWLLTVRACASSTAVYTWHTILSPEGWEKMMTVIASACAAFGLTVSEAKTEIMYVPANERWGAMRCFPLLQPARCTNKRASAIGHESAKTTTYYM